MRCSVAGIISEALKAARLDGSITTTDEVDIIIEKPRREKFGDYSSNIAMLLAPKEKCAPRVIADTLAKKIESFDTVEKTEVAGPGFINIFLKPSYWTGLLGEVLSLGAELGASEFGKGKKVQVEFVSANPTGPLHIGHGRGAVVGDVLANILKAAGFDVKKEFYINDAGRQVKMLGESVDLRRREYLGENISLGDDHYKGDYIKDIALTYLKHEEEGGVLGGSSSLKDFACEAMLSLIRTDLAAFGVEFDEWFSESSLDKKIDEAIEELREKGQVYDKDGAVWLRTEALGDDKDRVLIKADGERTYFASDIAYHRDKLQRGFDKLVDIWGADHHGYEARVRASLKALGYDDSLLNIIFIQMVSLMREGVPVQMGKRSGEFVTLRHVIDEVGRDACRYFFLMRKADAQLDFDLELAKKEATENPVYYVQYSHARICSILEHASSKSVELPTEVTDIDISALSPLSSRDDIELIKKLSAFEELVTKCAEAMEPHRITYYLQELAGAFHSYYNANRIVSEEEKELTTARLLLCIAVRTVIANGLKLLGVSAPDKM